MIFDAIRQGDAGQVRALLALDPTLAGSLTPEGAGTVLWAVYTRHAELAPLLLGSRPPDLFEACALGAADRVTELLTADPHLVAQYAGDGFTALGLAIFFGHRDLARFLLGAGADPNLPSHNALRVAPLHSACTIGDAALVGLLLRHGADPNAADSSGLTPLHTAAGHGNLEVLTLLLNAGASPTRQSIDGRTPAAIARQYHHPEAAAALGA